MSWIGEALARFLVTFLTWLGIRPRTPEEKALEVKDAQLKEALKPRDDDDLLGRLRRGDF